MFKFAHFRHYNGGTVGSRNAKSVLLGLVGGAGTWICGIAIARLFSSKACMNRPLGACWMGKGNGLAWFIETLGQTGITPLMVMVCVIAGIFLFLAILALGAIGEQSSSGKKFAKAYLFGLVIGAVSTLYLF